MQSRKITVICALFKVYTGEREWESIGDRLKGPCYLSRDTDDRKFRVRKQRTDVGKYCFVYRTIKLWNQLPAEALATFSCKSHTFRKRVKKIITRVGTLIVATICLQLIQNRYMYRSFTVLQCSHQHCIQPVASDVEVVGYL